MSEETPQGTSERDALYHLNEVRLGELAHRAIQRGMGINDFVTVCIDVDDPSWRNLVDELMPDHDWDAYRARGEKPIARGTVQASIVGYLSEVVPDIAPALKGNLPPGKARVVVMGNGGASVYHVTAIQPKLN